LVPTWKGLQPVRMDLVAGVAAGLLLLMTGLGRLARGLAANHLIVHCSLAAVAGAALLGNVVSARFAILALALCAALGGCAVIAGRSAPSQAVRGAVPVYVLVLGGLSLAGAVNSTLRMSFVLVPAAPLMVWLWELEPFASMRGKWRWLAQVFAV